jgi:hypothetical protein
MLGATITEHSYDDGVIAAAAAVVVVVAIGPLNNNRLF